jgi:hypothetical protein
MTTPGGEGWPGVVAAGVEVARKAESRSALSATV